MNLKNYLKDATDEEINTVMEYLTELQAKRQKEKEEPEHYYEFTGTWSWGTWAKTKEEAVKYFTYANIEEFEILTDEYKVVQYE